MGGGEERPLESDRRAEQRVEYQPYGLSCRRAKREHVNDFNFKLRLVRFYIRSTATVLHVTVLHVRYSLDRAGARSAHSRAIDELSRM